MANRASISRTVRYAHVPKTPVINASGDWEYKAGPTAADLAASATRLKDINLNATTALTRADVADAKAAAAKVSADSKATVQEAVEGARGDLFEFTPLPSPSGAVEYRKFDRIEFVEVKPSLWEINLYYHKMNDSTTYYGWLNYASRSDLNDLAARVAAIEQRLGISS